MKIVESNYICLFCRNEIKPKWEEYDQYYECGCEYEKSKINR